MPVPFDQFITGFHGLKAFTPEEYEYLQKAFTPRSFKAGELLVEQGNRSTYLYFILSGYLRKYHMDGNGNEITSEFNVPGAVAGAYYSFYRKASSFENVQAITGAEVLQISYPALQELYACSFNMNVIGRKLLEQACLSREAWLKNIVSLTGAEKYEWFRQEYPGISKVAQLKHIASFLGMKPETLSRIRRKFIS